MADLVCSGQLDLRVAQEAIRANWIEAYGGQQSSHASNMNQGVPMIHSPEQLKGLKPGSLFRAPDGRLKIVPMEAVQ